MSILAFTAALAAAAPEPPAPPRVWPTVEGWRVFELDYGCGIRRAVTGQQVTSVGLLLQDDGTIVVVLGKRPGITARDGRDHQLSYVLDGRLFAGRANFESPSAHSTYVTFLPPDQAQAFERSFASAAALGVSDRGTAVATVSLRGSTSALAVARRCLAAVRADRDAGIARQIARGSTPLEFIFAPAPPMPIPAPPLPPPLPAPPPPPEHGPRRAYLRSGWIGDDDYPAAAIRALAEGEVEMSLTVSEEGRVVACSVTRSSGNETLDSVSCMLIQLRFRYWPALDEQDRPVAETRTQRIRWQFPEEPPPVPAPPGSPPAPPPPPR